MTFEVDGVEIPKESLVGREEILAELLAKAQASTPEYGIELVDVQIKRINYVEQVRTRVYERMINERLQVAQKFRAEGEQEARRIRAEADKERQIITT